MSNVVNMIYGGGGSAASVDVRAYSEEKTSSGSEYEIQVYPVPNMTYYVIQHEEPDSPSEGCVWLVTGIPDYEFPVSDSVFVPVSGAKLFTSGAWVKVKTKCYINGRWVPNAIYFYNEGLYAENWRKTSSTGTLTFNSDHMAITGGSSSYSIDVSADVDSVKDSTYYIEYSSVRNTAYFRLVTSESTSIRVNMPSGEKNIVSIVADANYSGDNKALEIRCPGASNSYDIKIYKIWRE